MTTTYWTGGTSGDFYSNSNWSTNDSPFNYHDVNISGESATSTSTAIACSATSSVVPSLTVGNYGVLEITAKSGCSSTSPVFSTDSFQVFEQGSLIINTPSVVQLGQFNNLGGTLTIENNQSNVLFTPSDRLTGNGTLNLINSTFGSQTNSINIDNAMHVTLSGHSAVYTGFLATGVQVTFDGASSEKFFLNGNDTTVGTAFNNVSGKTNFGITANTGETPISASYEKNTDGTYSLVVQESGNHTLTLSNITMASDYTPGALTIEQDKSGNYLIVDKSSSSSNNGGGCAPYWNHNSGGKNGCNPSWNHHSSGDKNGYGSSGSHNNWSNKGQHTGSWNWGEQFNKGFHNSLPSGSWKTQTACGSGDAFKALTNKGYSNSFKSSSTFAGGSKTSWANTFKPNTSSHVYGVGLFS